MQTAPRTPASQRLFGITVAPPADLSICGAGAGGSPDLANSYCLDGDNPLPPSRKHLVARQYSGCQATQGCKRLDHPPPSSQAVRYQCKAAAGSGSDVFHRPAQLVPPFHHRQLALEYSNYLLLLDGGIRLPYAPALQVVMDECCSSFRDYSPNQGVLSAQRQDETIARQSFLPIAQVMDTLFWPGIKASIWLW